MSKNKIKIHFLTTKRFLLHKPTLLKAAKSTISFLPKSITKPLKSKTYSLTLFLVTDKTIHKLNKTYRKKNKPTDVLAFSRLESAPLPTLFPEIGDVIVSIDTAKRQAKEYECSLSDELSRLTVHGVLHLFGYDHEISKKEEKRMFVLQKTILKKITRG